MAKNDLDNLVDQITTRVKQRLERPAACTPRSAATRKGGAPLIELPDSTPYSFFAGKKENRAGVKKPAEVPAAVPDNELARLIDHTLLKPEAGKAELEKLCQEARTYRFATVCVNSANIPTVARLLEGSGVLPIAVVGFPLGAATSGAKAFEAKEAVAQGAREIDMVLNIGALKSRDYRLVLEDIRAVVEASAPYPVKVILETSYLDHDQKVIACVLSKIAGAAFVKTSTGFGGGGATVEDIQLMRHVVGPDMGVKASGGVRSREDLERMVAAGASRVGTSSSVSIVLGKGGGTGY